MEHSRSPELYAPMFDSVGIDAEFLRLCVKKEEIGNIRELIRQHRLSGFAVTMPHKRAIMDYLDEISIEAHNAGSVNIVSVERGHIMSEPKLVGYNTDGDGLIAALNEVGVNIAGKSIAILGNGGAAAGAKEAIIRNGGNIVTLIRHDGLSLNRVLKDSYDILMNCDVLINSTPLGMKGYPEFESFEFLNMLKPTAVIADMVYASAVHSCLIDSTQLVYEAKKRRLISFSGDRMLLHQGLIAFKLWTGYDLSHIIT